jgi:hypothetical protein
MAVITSSAAERIVVEILSATDDILIISIIDEKGGNILASRSNESFKKRLHYLGRRVNMVEPWVLHPLLWQVN